MKHKRAANQPVPEESQALPSPVQRVPSQRGSEQGTQKVPAGSCPQLSQGQEGRTHLLGAREQTEQWRRVPLWPGPLALLIDGENISPQDADEILTYAQTHGAVCIRRISGNWGTAAMTRWREAGWQHGLTPIHHAPAKAGKNGCDIALVVDAMQLYEEGIRTFVLASSDSDSVPLVRRLHERGCIIIGMGRKQTHLSFKRVCTQFVELGCPIASSALGSNSIPVSIDGSCIPSQPQDQTASHSVEHKLGTLTIVSYWFCGKMT